VDEAAWESTFSLNVTSAFLFARAVLPTMIERHGGSVVNLTSDQAFQPTSGRAAYSAAKAAIVGLTRALAVDCGQHGVRVNAVAPGPTLTEKTRQMGDEQALAALAARHPTRRLATPEDVAETIAFLLSGASRHITGQVLHVNGGLLMG